MGIKKKLYLRTRKYNAVVAQLVEHQLPKLRVAGSSPVYRSTKVATRLLLLYMQARARDPLIRFSSKKVWVFMSVILLYSLTYNLYR